MTTLADCARLRDEYVKKEMAALPNYAYGYDEGQRYPKISFTDPIHRQADALYIHLLEKLARASKVE
jgi:hypothetical protein